MTIRKKTEEIERRTLHPGACLSEKSKGRMRPEKEDDVRTCFQRDRDRIIHSKAFRRLKHKTQVFMAPEGDHYRTRLTHVLEVSQIGRTVSRALRLNEDLTEAIALGHDLGHTPFGHAGEAFLGEIHPGGFYHFKQSLRVVDYLERGGRGLNLTHEVREGIVKHSKGKGVILLTHGPQDSPDIEDMTLEAQAVRLSDVIAYLNHDLDDALRAKVLKKGDIPPDILKTLGDRHSKRIDTMVRDAIQSTEGAGHGAVCMSPRISEATYRLRDFLYERVYEDENTKREFTKARKILEDLYSYYLEHIEEVFADIPKEDKEDRHRTVCDFIAGMTDNFALATYQRLFMPEKWKVY